MLFENKLRTHYNKTLTKPPVIVITLGRATVASHLVSLQYLFTNRKVIIVGEQQMLLLTK